MTFPADLNEMVRFARVVEHGGFSAAARALGVQASALSRSVQNLERELGVRLLNRSTRQISTTEVGQTFYRHCERMVATAIAAHDSIDTARTAPQGVVRLTCPYPLIAPFVAPIVQRYLTDHPQVVAHLQPRSDPVDIVKEGVDIAIRIRRPPLEDSDLVVRKLTEFRLILVASPWLLSQQRQALDIDTLGQLPSVSLQAPGEKYEWDFSDTAGTPLRVAHHPRFVSDDMGALRLAALAGLGVGLLPTPYVADDLSSGALKQILPELSMPQGIIFAAFASNRGLVPAVRGLIDALVGRFPDVGQARIG